MIATSGWFAARPSGTESIYKIYAESFKDRAHLEAILREAQEIVEQRFEGKNMKVQETQRRAVTSS